MQLEIDFKDYKDRKLDKSEIDNLVRELNELSENEKKNKEKAHKKQEDESSTEDNIKIYDYLNPLDNNRKTEITQLKIDDVKKVEAQVKETPKEQVKTEAVEEAKAGKIEYRLDKTNIIHCPIGKASFGVEKLQENFDTLMGAIVKAKPAAAKGQYVKSCVVSATMGPGVKINPARFV